MAQDAIETFGLAIAIPSQTKFAPYGLLSFATADSVKQKYNATVAQSVEQLIRNYLINQSKVAKRTIKHIKTIYF